MGQVQTRVLADAGRGQDGLEAFQTCAQARFDEIDIARMFESCGQGQRPVSRTEPAMDWTVSEPDRPGAVDRFVGSDGAGVQRGKADQWFDNGSGQVARGHGPVQQRPRRFVPSQGRVARGIERGQVIPG